MLKDLVTTAAAFLNMGTLRNSYSLGEGNADSMVQLEYHMAAKTRIFNKYVTVRRRSDSYRAHRHRSIS
jgi:hypothetical protein